MDNPRRFPSKNKVLVVGGGVAGIRTSLDLAEAGRDVVLVDAANAIGGLMTQLDRTFPTNVGGTRFKIAGALPFRAEPHGFDVD